MSDYLRELVDEWKDTVDQIAELQKLADTLSYRVYTATIRATED